MSCSSSSRSTIAAGLYLTLNTVKVHVKYNERMQPLVLATKLYLPSPRPNLVPRPRLIDRLNQGLHTPHGVTLVSAPAGFGKTTLLGEWLAVCGKPAAWLSLDAGDSDPLRFLAYLVAALQTVAPALGAGAPAALQSPQPPPVEWLLTALLNEIAALPHDFIFVLDDYHAIDAEPVDQALAFLVERLPPQMHLVIATRQDPPLPLARLRARGRLTELRSADLRFTPAEAADFLNRVMGLNLSPQDIAALEARTEGWIAGLQLAAISMQGREDTAGFIQSFTGSHRFVLDYLVEEVLNRQPAGVQAFLLRTAILERLCGPLCDAVLGEHEASLPATGQDTLERLERANLFIVPLDHQRRWYRYHHLFAELLRQRLGKPADLPELHLRAGRWHEENGNLLDAIHHALAAGEFEGAARLAEAAWQAMDRSFQTAAWLGRVNQLPNAVVCSRPVLCMQIGWAYSDLGRLEQSEAYLQNAERALAEALRLEGVEALPATIALIRSSNAQILGDLAQTVKYAELSMRLIPDGDQTIRPQAAVTLGFTHWAAGDLEPSLRALREWIADMRRLGNYVFEIASVFAEADMLAILGRLGEAEKSLRQAIRQADTYGAEAVAVTAHHHLALALLAHERGDAAASEQHLQTAAEIGRRTTLIDWPYRWSLAQARLKEFAAEWDAAIDLLDEAGRVYVKNPIPLLRPIAAMKARIDLKQGRLDTALAWARRRGLSTADEVRYLDEYEYLTLARVRLVEGDFSGVDEMLERLLAQAQSQKRMGSALEILLTQALVHQAQNNQAGALAALERALALAEPEGYLAIFVEEGETLRRLLMDYRSANEAQPAPALRAYVDKILGAFSPPPEGVSATRPAKQPPEIIEPLTDREIEILRLIAQGCSNADIGRRLYLALSTVKGHNLRIFSKLQAQNRTEAVARARRLGYL